MGQTPSKKTKKGKDKGKDDSPESSQHDGSPSDSGSLAVISDDDGSSTVRGSVSRGTAPNGVNVDPNARSGGASTLSEWSGNGAGANAHPTNGTDTNGGASSGQALAPASSCVVFVFL